MLGLDSPRLSKTIDQVESLSIPMKMKSTQTGRTLNFIDIAATVRKLGDLVPELLPAHALTGCNTVPMYHEIGKSKMLRIVKAKKYSLSLLGDVNACMEDVILLSYMQLLWCVCGTQCQ